MNKDPSYYQMTPEREEHLQAIKDAAIANIDTKYRSGESEHGGNLWEKDILKEALDEAYDLVVYLTSLKQMVKGEHMSYLKEDTILRWLLDHNKLHKLNGHREVIDGVEMKNTVEGREVYVLTVVPEK